MRKRQIYSMMPKKEKGRETCMRAEMERRKESGGKGEKRNRQRERRQDEWKGK